MPLPPSVPYTLNKLWTAFYKFCIGLFVAVLLMFPALIIGGLVGQASSGCFSCGVMVATTFWIMGVCAYPSVWRRNTLSFLRRLTIWLTATMAGVITSIGLKAIMAALLRQVVSGELPTVSLSAGHAQIAAWLGVTIYLSAPMMVAWIGSRLLVRLASGRTQAVSPSADTRQSLQPLERPMTVHGDSFQNEGRTQTDGASVGSGRVRATAGQRKSFALKIVAKAVASVGLFFVALILIVLVGFLSVPRGISDSTAWAILIAVYVPGLFYLWGSAPLWARVRDGVRLWLARDGRLVPFYVAAILVSIAALRYILSGWFAEPK